jgi:hypothetical protein
MPSTVPGACRRGPGARPASVDGIRRQLAACRPAGTGWPPTAGTRQAPTHASLAGERMRARHRPGASAANGRAWAPAGASRRPPGPPGLLEGAARPYAYALACIAAYDDGDSEFSLVVRISGHAERRLCAQDERLSVAVHTGTDRPVRRIGYPSGRFGAAWSICKRQPKSWPWHTSVFWSGVSEEG